MARLEGVAAAMALFVCAAPAMARAQQKPITVQAAKAFAADVATQPARDIGLMKTRVPPLLIEVQKDPYSLDGISSCDQLSAAIGELNQLLGPDYVPVADPRGSRRIRVTGSTVASLFVPFRGVIREVSGAAPAQRHLDAAIDAGLARRGFLRGVQTARRCR